MGEVRKVATILIVAGAATLVAAVAVDRLDGSARERRIGPLVVARLIPAGTPGESILQQQQRYITSPSVVVGFGPEDLIYDPAYLRGREAVVDIRPGRYLVKRDFRLEP